MKIAILGGSFNPIHNGHLALAEAVRVSFQYDRIILIPAFQSPFKPEFMGSQAHDRLDMCAAAISGDSAFTLDDCEIKREGVSYTIDTVKYIDQTYRPEGKLGLIIGDDLAADFHKWREAESLAANCEIILARRFSDDQNKTPFPFPHKRLQNDIVELSSRMIRERIKEKSSWHFFVPPSVRFIIEERNLYDASQRTNRETHPLAGIIAHIENHARMLLPLDRFLHSRNTALLSFELCNHFKLNPYKGYLAGIAHDLCKTMNQNRLIELAQKDGEEISKIEQKKPALLHGRAAAVYLKELFNIHDEDILEAIRFHTYASESLGALGKVVYVTDKIEFSRKEIDPKIRDFKRFDNLNTLFELVFKENVAYLKAKNLILSEGTLKLMDAIQRRKHSS